MHQGVYSLNYTFSVYIMASRSGTLYVGITSELEIRVRQHKTGEIEGFAAKYRCTRLVYYESFDNVLKAIAREKLEALEKGFAHRKCESTVGGLGGKMGS